MKYNHKIGIGISFGLIGIVTILLSIRFNMLVFLVMGVLLIVVSVLLTVFIASWELFQRDKVLNIEELIAQNLSPIVCENCSKINVNEDIYCINCGEKLVKTHE